MKLRSHLLWLTLAILLPMVIFGVSATTLIARRERAVFQRGAQERTLAVRTALDIELAGHLTSLRALASSETLAMGDLRAFYDEAARILTSQPNWRGISLTLPSGHHVFQTTESFGADVPPIRDRPSFERVLRTGQPATGNLVLDGEDYRIPVRLPVLRNGQARYVLSVMIDPQTVLSLLSSQRLPPDWVGVVVDGNGRIVARTLDHVERLGQPASDSLRTALDRGTEGWFQGSTIEGTSVYTPFNRSPFSGWTVALGIPTAVVDSAATRAVWQLALGTLLAIAIALLLAIALGRRISTPIVSLASAATALGRGTPIVPSPPGGIREVDDVRHALVQASNAIREREDALLAADRAKDEFLAMLGHELRNPLGALASASALLKLRPAHQVGADSAVSTIDRQVQHMTHLVDDLLDVSRATSGKIQLSRQPRDLAEIVTAALRIAASAGRLAGHDVRVDVSPVWVEADETRTQQIVSNLVDNAVKFTAPGGRIAVRVFPRNGEAVLQVEDTGAGLPAALLPRIFDLFMQGERSLDRSSGGLGIGLTLVKRLTELHGGRVTAASEGRGRGSVFTVVLPAIDAPHVASPGLTVRPPSGDGCRVLLIEDHDDAREMMRTALAHYGYTVVDAPDGPSGIQSATETDPDVVVIDLGLPKLDGYEVARQLRAMPERQTTILIALTGYGQPEARQRALDAGFNEHVTKPVMPDRLAQIIASIRAHDVA